MCEFCHKHGEGKKWYLQARNYSDDLISDARRRRHAIWSLKQVEEPGKAVRLMKMISRTRGVVRRLVSWASTKVMKRFHFGQVVPIEDVERILEITNSVVRMACLCRHAQGTADARYCYGLSIRPDFGILGEIVREASPDYLVGPDTAGLERLTREDALRRMREHEMEGLCHTVWTLYTPFIAGICNCDRSGCLAVRATLERGFRVMFRAEYVAVSNPALCSGCGECVHLCQFGAIGLSAATGKVEIDPGRCYGCGVCRAACGSDAISLPDRRTVAEAKDLW
ncbi:MAG: 4Fe-4S dicluster domain-containing protein [Planctomycetota bacterium]|jgi:ferredoxin